MVSSRDLKHEKGHPSQPWDGGESREGFLDEVVPMPDLRGQEGASQMEGVDARLGRGVPDRGDRMRQLTRSQVSLPDVTTWESL